MMSSTSTPPPPYNTDQSVTSTGLNIQINWDSSVANAPPSKGSPGSPGFVPGFVYDVEQVANFFATELQYTGPNAPITITIDVGYGEINGSKIGNSALGESLTNLQQVSYSNLYSAYTTYTQNNAQNYAQTPGLTDLLNNLPSSPPNGKFYVSDAEAQALGIDPTNPPVDGFIGFSSQSGTFDYNTNIFSSSGTVQSGAYDFEGTVAHEISEVLGREFLGSTKISLYDFFHYSSGSNGPVHDFAANGGGYFSTDGGLTPFANFNMAHGGDGADWGAGGTSGSAFDAFNAFGTPGKFSPVTPTDLLVLGALGFPLTSAAATEAAKATAVPVSSALTQTTVQNTGGSGSSQGLDHTVALFNQFIAAGFPEQHGGQITTNALSQVATNEQQFLANPHHG
jgi:hypothetical protein